MHSLLDVALAAQLDRDRPGYPACHRRAALTSARKRPASATTSGCHCTPTTEPLATGLHRLQSAVPGPGHGLEARVLAHGLVVVAAHAQRAAVRRGASAVGQPAPLARRRRRRRRTVGARGRGCVAPSTSGRCCSSDPPACDGHHLHARGRPRASAGRARSAAASSASSQASRSGRGHARPRMRLLAVLRRVDVRPAGDHQPVEPRRRPRPRRSSYGAVGGSSTGTPPTRLDRCGVRRGQQVGRLVPDAPLAPARGRCSARSAAPSCSLPSQSGVT